MGKRFIPVGHISLNKEYETPGYAAPAEGFYWIANFYISDALQGMGLGRAAMDAVESMAISEPLCAETLALSTLAREYVRKGERWTALGKEPPKVGLYETTRKRKIGGLTLDRWRVKIGTRGEDMKCIREMRSSGPRRMRQGRCGGSLQFL
jgi:GNAT superfamily N-acetyltransferase